TPAPRPAVPAAPVAPKIPEPPPTSPKAESWSMDDFPSPPIPGIDSDAPTNPGVPSEAFTSQPLAPLEEDQPIAIEMDSSWKAEVPSSEPDEEWQKKDLSHFTVNVPLNQLNGEVDVQINPDIDADIEFKTSVQQRFGSTGSTSISNIKAAPAVDAASQGAPKVHPHNERELKARQARESAAANERAGASKATVPVTSPSMSAISQEDMKQLVQNQTQELLREMIQKIVPEMATRMIQAEIERLLSERGPTE
ncbi:MAG: hypothetical protein K2X47_02845, partial [Bdellovibrionales bacterium]|nr:hypothetical protein [Bdellovibrionales bacterium]